MASHSRLLAAVHRSPFTVHRLGLPVYRLPLTVHLLLLFSARLAAQDQLQKAFDLERRGSYFLAVDAYRAVLTQRPGEVSALLGLERSLVPLNRLPEIIPQVRAAIASNPTLQPVYAVAIRAWSAAHQVDSLQPVVEQWAKVAPGEETPFREWGNAALMLHDKTTARRAYQLGRDRLGQPDALAPEFAQLAVLDEEWPAALKEWVKAVHRLPGYRPTAIAAMGDAPESIRPELLRTLEKDDAPESKRMLVDLRARWGDPAGAFTTLMRSLPATTPEAVDALQQFLDAVRGANTPAGQRAQAMALEALADRTSGATQKARARLEAARTYALAGDRASARRMLQMIASDSSSAPAVAAGATSTLIGLLVDEGKVEEASKRLDQYQSTMGVEDYLSLRRQVALGWARAGQASRAEQMLASDSTVEGSAAIGRIRLYSGDLKGAVEALQVAGPYAGTREEATQRSATLALLQPILQDSLPELGDAFLKLDKGDTTAALVAFQKVSASLPPAAGGAEFRLLVGTLQVARGQLPEGEKSLRAAMVKEAPSTAAAAALELGRLLMRDGRQREATETLEQMILDYPTSALVPQARRLLDQARNAVPQT